MEAMEELIQLSDSMIQAAALLADADPDEPSSNRTSTFLNVVALGNVVSPLLTLLAPFSPSLTRGYDYLACSCNPKTLKHGVFS